MMRGKPEEQSALAQRIGERIRYLRKAVGIEIRQLAESLGVSRNTIANFETGRTEPSAGELARIAQILGCGVSELLQDSDVTGPRFAFRAHKALRKDPKILVAAQRFLRSYEEIEEITGAGLTVKIPHFEIDRRADAGENLSAQIENAANWTRNICSFSEWGPGGIAYLLESLGIRCHFFTWDGPGLDAISTVRGDLRLVMLNKRTKSVERTILSAAHELGHLVLHPELFTLDAEEESCGIDYERESNLFAGCFLAPTKDLVRVWNSERLDRLPLEQALLLLKEVFGVSFWALYRRVEQTGLSRMDYPYMVQKVKRFLGIEGRAKMEDLEPNPLPPDVLLVSTRFTRLVHSAFLQEKIGVAKTAEMLQITVEDAKSVTADWVAPRIDAVE